MKKIVCLLLISIKYYLKINDQDGFSFQGRQSVLKSEGNRLENEEVRGYMLP